MSPEYARPYVKAQKNDGLEARAVAEAGTRPTMRFVPVKGPGQSDLSRCIVSVSGSSGIVPHLSITKALRGGDRASQAPQGGGGPPRWSVRGAQPARQDSGRRPREDFDTRIKAFDAGIFAIDTRLDIDHGSVRAVDGEMGKNSQFRVFCIIINSLNKLGGAGGGTRTPDPIITNDVLYQLSYTGAEGLLAASKAER